MSKKINFQDILTAVKRMAIDVIERLKKMDRRLLIMIASAVVLLIIVIALIASGVKANKKDIPKAETSTEDAAVLYKEPGTDNTNNTVVAVGAGKYKVNTGSDADLNMRRAAGSKYDRITSIPNGTIVDVLFVDDQVDAKGWGYIRYNGDSGWVSMEYLTPNQ